MFRLGKGKSNKLDFELFGTEVKTNSRFLDDIVEQEKSTDFDRDTETRADYIKRNLDDNNIAYTEIDGIVTIADSEYQKLPTHPFRR